MIGSMGAETRAVAAKAVSLLLRYPDREVLAAMPALRAALPELPERLAEPLSIVEHHRAAGDPTALAVEYVELFDLRRRCCLHLSYYTAGDTRKRGEALLEFAAAYKSEGLAVADGELPDYLPAVLDLAAHGAIAGRAADGGSAGRAADGGGAGWDLLRRHRIGLDLLSQALRAQHSVYRHAVDAARMMLPAATASDLASAATLARSGPPREEVGLQPFTLAPGGRR